MPEQNLPKENIYFIAIIPPVQICEAITSFRLDFANRFNSKAAMKVIPHITLKAPFKLSPREHAGLIQWIHTLTFNGGPFEIELLNFGAFNKKRNPVVFVKPVLSKNLSHLQAELIRSFRQVFPSIPVTEHELHFHPHITIAYRDLGFASFSEAWKEYETKEYHSTFMADQLSLLQHNGKGWNVIDAIPLK